jgi:hypothetical protein
MEQIEAAEVTYLSNLALSVDPHSGVLVGTTGDVVAGCAARELPQESDIEMERRTR